MDNSAFPWEHAIFGPRSTERIGLVVSAPDLKLGDPGSSLGVAHETNA
jgi:hypothetical protein